ncbi:MAG: LytTR family DNA-binding domain-containing protein [Bacteroidota bacterium]
MPDRTPKRTPTANQTPGAQPSRMAAMVVDDEPPARRKLVRWLNADPEIEVVATCGDGVEALEAYEAQPTALLFLDVQMPGLSGFDVLQRLPREPAPVVVFATAFDRFAIDAFNHHAAGYLLKPYSQAQFAATLAHAKQQVRGRAQPEAMAHLAALADALQPTQPYVQHLAVRQADRVDVVQVGDVDWIEAQGNYVLVHAAGQRHLIRETLTRVASRLDPRRFPRVHRSAVVNLDRVASLIPASHGDFMVLLRDGTEVPMSRTYRAGLRSVLEIGF